MSIIEATILGIIQGLTEFLPVSSSGHLELAKVILGDNSIPEESLLFTIVLHFATALSTLVIFRKEIFEIFEGLFKFQWNEETQFSLKIIVSMIPTVFIGLFFEEEIAFSVWRTNSFGRMYVTHNCSASFISRQSKRYHKKRNF